MPPDFTDRIFYLTNDHLAHIAQVTGYGMWVLEVLRPDYALNSSTPTWRWTTLAVRPSYKEAYQALRDAYRDIDINPVILLEEKF